MPRYLRNAIVVALFALPSVVTIAAVHNRGQQDVMRGAAEWVPFTADTRQVLPDGRTVMLGRVLRTSDGSTRREGWFPDGTERWVGIVNVAAGRFYKLNPGHSEWISRPLKLPEGGWRPKSILRRLIAAEGPAMSGFETVRIDTLEERIYQAPALNFENLRIESSNGTQLVEHIVLEEPLASLFAPADGASVRVDPTPGGIVAGSRVPGPLR